MNCKRCNAELEANARFCPACGALQPMVCPHCGAESRPGSRDCSVCGKKLPLADREDKLVYTKRKKHTGAIIGTVIGVLCALLLLGGAVLFLLDSLNFEKDATLASQEQEQTVPEPEEVVEPESQPSEEVPVVNVEPEQEPVEEDEPPVEEEAPVEEEPTQEPPVEEEEPPVEEKPPVEEPQADSEWIFADSSERLLTDADIAGLSAWELKVARNEIYARNGRMFTSAELKAHFEGCSWYNGTIAPENFSDTMLSKTELANVQFLKAAE